jgi:hypothetical protein
MAIAANKAPGSFGRYAPVIAALQSELAKLNGEAIEGYANYAASAADPSVTGDPLQPPPRPGVQALDHDIPLTPAPADPPHGKDPRYWIDVTKIIHVPDGQLAPYGTVQIGPGLYYPDPTAGFTNAPPPPPAKYPLDIGDIMTPADSGRTVSCGLDGLDDCVSGAISARAPSAAVCRTLSGTVSPGSWAISASLAMCAKGTCAG